MSSIFPLPYQTDSYIKDDFISFYGKSCRDKVPNNRNFETGESEFSSNYKNFFKKDKKRLMADTTNKISSARSFSENKHESNYFYGKENFSVQSARTSTD